MKCVGFGSVQALWLGRLQYKERWQQAVDGKKHGFHIFHPKPQASHIALRNHATLSLRMPPTLALHPLSSSKTVIIDWYFFFFSSVWWYFRADSSVFVYMNHSVNKSCSLLCRLLIILLNLEVPLSQREMLKWRISECMCVHLCTYSMCKYRKRRRNVVQRFKVEFSPRHLHKRTRVVIALSSC